MSTVSVYTTVNTVTVNNTTNSVDVTQSTNQVDITLGTIVGTNLTCYSYNGSDFSGADGASGRSKTITNTRISTSAFVGIGYRLLIPSVEFTISTTSTTNDTITITGALYNQDSVLIWT